MCDGQLGGGGGGGVRENKCGGDDSYECGPR